MCEPLRQAGIGHEKCDRLGKQRASIGETKSSCLESR